jgi:hypothetical protein
MSEWVISGTKIPTKSLRIITIITTTKTISLWGISKAYKEG